jgi:hypothetical protein
LCSVTAASTVVYMNRNVLHSSQPNSIMSRIAQRYTTAQHAADRMAQHSCT